MDFSLVKRLFIPQGEVTKITNLEGITLWQKISRVLKEWRGLSPLTCTPTVAGEFEEVKVYGQSKQGILPDGYTQLEYIESTGTQYIDTGFKLNTTHSYDLKLNTLSESSSGIFGARSRMDAGATTNDNISIFANVSGANTMYIDYNTRNIKTVNANTDVEITISPTEIILDGVSTPIVTKKTVNGTYNISLFGINTGGTIAKSNTRFYSFKIRDEQNKAVQNLIPAKRNSDNVSGMYDTVTNTFLTNAGDGEFVSGYTVPTPTAPIEVESVGEKTENLWNPNTVLINSWIGTDGKIGLANNGSVNVIEVEQNNTYYFTTFWGDKTGDTRYSCLAGFDADMNFVAGSRKILTQPNANNIEQVSTTIDNTSIKYIGFATYMTAPYSWMVRKNDNKTDYIPYGYKVPVEVGGKNLFKDTSLTKQVRWATSITEVVNELNKLNTGTYTLSCEFELVSRKDTTDASVYGFYSTNNTPIIDTRRIWQTANVGTIVRHSTTFNITDTTKGNFSNSNLFVYGCGIGTVGATGTAILRNFQIEQGTQATEYQPYVAPTTTNIYLNEPLRKIGGYADTASIVKSKNLFDKNDTSSYIRGYLEDNGIIPSAGNGYILLLECKPNTTYTFSRKESSNRYRVGSTPNLKKDVKVGTSGITLISNKSVSATVLTDTFTTTSDAKTLVVWFTNTSDLSVLQSQLNQIQIEEGSTATPYTPYNSTEVTVTRNVGSSTISSKNPMSVRGDISNNRFLITNINQNALNDTSLICNLYKYDGQSFDGGANFTITGISSLSNGRVCIRDNRYNTLQDFQNYIINSNIEIILPLATPTTETYTIESPIMALDNTSIITVDTTVPPSEVYASEWVEE